MSQGIQNSKEYFMVLKTNTEVIMLNNQLKLHGLSTFKNYNNKNWIWILRPLQWPATFSLQSLCILMLFPTEFHYSLFIPSLVHLQLDCAKKNIQVNPDRSPTFPTLHSPIPITPPPPRINIDY